MRSSSSHSVLPSHPPEPIPSPSIMETGQSTGDRRTRASIQFFSGVCFVLSSLFLLSGCGEEVQTGTTVKTDAAKVKAEQDAMKEAMEKSHQRPTKGR